MTQEQKEYDETYNHYRNLIEKLGIERIQEVYRDALFMVVPHHRLSALRDALTDARKVTT
jgi:hypothetical protein